MPVNISPVPSSPGLVSLARVKEVIASIDDTTDHDDAIQEWIDAESARFERDIAQPVRSETITRIYEGHGTAAMILRYWPVTDISLVERATSATTWEAIDDTTYALTGDGKLYRITATTGFTRNVPYRVTLTVGYDDVPADIAEAVRDAVVMRWLDSPIGGNRMGKASDGVAGATGEKNITTSYTRADTDRRWAETVARYQKIHGF